ncbi:hypothetical protein QEH59_03055 [Coraliomargarita sp. SDUM461004]|uniref:Uncharacterized protein n=1 Tax=Thalassobacterium sedimentorum TaxID=3041258 RepID=A0ABU1AFE4_9BACT|nr:hypothetical protein [Coraliomargarita sp. SDUM461004]
MEIVPPLRRVAAGVCGFQNKVALASVCASMTFRMTLAAGGLGGSGGFHHGHAAGCAV